MARAPVTTKVALGRCSGGQGRAFRLQALDPPGETQSWVPEPFTAGKESENCRAGRHLSSFIPFLICQMRKLRLREVMRIGQGSTGSSFQLLPQSLC